MFSEPLQIEDLSAPAGQRILRLSGPILISNFFEFQSLVRSSSAPALILDLSGVPYIDSAGIGALVGAYVTHQKNGRRLALVGVTERVRNSMQVTRVEQFFHFYDTVAAAQPSRPPAHFLTFADCPLYFAEKDAVFTGLSPTTNVPDMDCFKSDTLCQIEGTVGLPRSTHPSLAANPAFRNFR
jgi:anti-sigma B factor antagonist